jgi:xanthine dehydrogenase YagS FAD-binding subunit
MKPFKHFNASSVSEAASILAGYAKGEAKVNSGGTDLMGTLKDDIFPVYPKAIVNIKSIPNLDYIKEEGGMLKIGANATLDDIANSSVVKGKWSILAQSAHLVASPAIRNVATIGGNICQNSRCW